MSTQKYFTLSDGAKLAYDIYGEEHSINQEIKTLPVVFFGGTASTKDDWVLLIHPLSKTRTVVTFDWRGIGLSTYSTPENNDQLSIESMARDAIALIESFKWLEVDIVALSMGGTVLQQMLFFDRHPTAPLNVPFNIRHAVLSATFASPIPPEYFPKPLPKKNDAGQEFTDEQKLNIALPLLEASLGPNWIAAPRNAERLKVWMENVKVNRPFKTNNPSVKQRKMILKFSFVDDLQNVSPDTEVLVIHGIEDIVVPFLMAEEILRACPKARLVSIGSKRGQVPSYRFGHLWNEYFDIDVWVGVLEVFFDESVAVNRSAL